MQVKKAVLDDDTEVAVKYLLHEDTNSTASKQEKQLHARGKFEAEIHMMNELRGHPNICTFIGACLDPVGFLLLAAIPCWAGCECEC